MKSAIKAIWFDPVSKTVTVRYSGVSYAAVLQQMTRHRAFSFSVESSRAADLPLDFEPDWSVDTGGKMFSAVPAGPSVSIESRRIWNHAKRDAIKHAMALKELGLHRQHWQLPLKAFSTVSMFVTGHASAWEHFLRLRLDVGSAQIDIRHVAVETASAFVRAGLDEHVPQVKCVRIEPNLSQHLFVQKADPKPFSVLLGPYLPPAGVNLYDALTPNGKALADSPAGRLVAEAITRVARVSTGRTDESIEIDRAQRFVERLLVNEHVSPFEHFYVPAPGIDSGNLRDAIQLRKIFEPEC